MLLRTNNVNGKCLFTCDNGISCVQLSDFSSYNLGLELLRPVHAVCVCVCVCSYIGAEGWVQHVGLQPLKVDVSENGVPLDLYGPSPLAT